MQIHSSSLAFNPLPQQHRSAEGAEVGKEKNVPVAEPKADNRSRESGDAETYIKLAGLNRQELYPVRQSREVAPAENQPGQYLVRQALNSYRETLGQAVQDSAATVSGIDFYV